MAEFNADKLNEQLEKLNREQLATMEKLVEELLKTMEERRLSVKLLTKPTHRLALCDTRVC